MTTIMVTENLATKITMSNMMMKSMYYLGRHKQVAAQQTIYEVQYSID